MRTILATVRGSEFRRFSRRYAPRMPTDTQLAVQLYTLREHTKTPADIATTFEKLAKQG